MAEPEDQGYTVKDRRHHQLSEEEKQAEPPKEAPAAEPGSGEVPLPEITFSSFIFSLGSSAFIHLGALPDPASGEVAKNLAMAKQTIDLLALLREKTRNNLTSEEENLFDHLLYDLRMQYIKVAG